MSETQAGPQAGDPPGTRIQRLNRDRILDGALPVFAALGYGGATIDRIAQAAGLSKPNVLYYFAGKEAIYEALLRRLLDLWLEPLRQLDHGGDPVEEMLKYVRIKLKLSREHPDESRLFAAEILQGAPRLNPILQGQLKPLVDDQVRIIRRWMDQGRLAQVDPHHLIFSIWALTQHYADFNAQVTAVLGPGHDDPYAEAGVFLEGLYRRLLAP
ncbi:TetR family transcriptional regulator C-terminal domain-containing protein [Paracoccus pacificus]|uniref:TetR family transcriptional regulator C-terminal domain-containing protein n=1 Tax=Paracoccus pacificus TaxID=1463598 RepID=A0ABW4R8J6_9RHOB